MAIAGWFESMMAQRGVKYQELRHRVAVRAGEASRRGSTGTDVPSRLVVALADGRPVVLIVPTSRRVVLARVEKLLCADEVQIVRENEIENLFIDGRSETKIGLYHAPINMLIDASLFNAGDLVIQSETPEDTIRLRFEDWSSLASPGVAFFTEPYHDSSPAISSDQRPHVSESDRAHTQGSIAT